MKKILTAAFILALTLLLASCNFTIPTPPSDNPDNTPPSADDGVKDPEEGDKSEEEIPENYRNDDITFDKYERVMIVVSPENADFAYGAQHLITGITEIPAITVTDDYEGDFANELVIGRSNRKISDEAYSYLEGYDRAHSFIARFAIYSEGNTVALAFDEVAGYNDYVIQQAIEAFTAKYVRDEGGVNLLPGELCLGSVDIMEYQEKLDEDRFETVWRDFEFSAGKEAADVLREMYGKIYSSDKLSAWLAGLFDPEIGGFYYSNSARDNDKVLFNGGYYDLLPDIESTVQAAGFINSSGLIYGTNSLKEALPEWMRQAIIKFLKERQDPNGYFYHPQWTKAMVDSELSRRGRDLSNAVSLLQQLGARPTYNTPLGVKGDGLLYDGTPVSAITLPISASVASAVSFVKPSASAVPSHLKNEASFRAYLSGLNIKGNSYWVGNQLAAQALQIKARDAVLQGEGADYSLVEILHTWMDENCDPKTGNWSGKANYAGLNGLMKISSVYQTLGLPLPYPEASVESAIATIDTTEYNSTVCFAYNSWVTVCNVINNVKKHKPVSEADAIVESITSSLRERAPELIRITLEKQGIFLCEDGSFSYTVKSSSALSQGLPVAVAGTKEGDVNATVICTTGTLSHMFTALGYPKVPILYRSDFNKMLIDIESRR